jgi:CRP-like cAMP-binding protein
MVAFIGNRSILETEMQITLQPISTRLLDNLGRATLLSNLPMDTLREISDYVQMRTVPAGQTLYTPDQPADGLHLLFQGAIKLYRLSDTGKIAITAILQPGELFGEMAFFRDSYYGNFAEAATDVEVGIIPHSDAQLLLRHGEIAQRIIRMMANRVNQLEFQLTAIALKPVSERVIAI